MFDVYKKYPQDKKNNDSIVLFLIKYTTWVTKNVINYSLSQ